MPKQLNKSMTQLIAMIVMNFVTSKIEINIKLLYRKQGNQKISKKNSPNFSKNSPKSCQVKKKAKIFTAKPKHLQQTNFETLKYLQQTML
jgi:hypothetical protein